MGWGVGRGLTQSRAHSIERARTSRLPFAACFTSSTRRPTFAALSVCASVSPNKLAARSNGIDVTRIKVVVYIITAFGTAMIGALIFLQKLRISPDAAFSVNDWTAFVIFMTVIGGIGRIEGPIVGAVVFFLLRQTLSDLGTLYLLLLGSVAIVVMLWAPKGIWGLIVERFGWQVFPLERRVVLDDRGAPATAGQE